MTHPCVWRCCCGHRPCPWPHCCTWHCLAVHLSQMVLRKQCWSLCGHCACVLGCIALHHCCCQCCTGIIFLVMWALLFLLRWHCCPHRLCVATSIANWRLPRHKAVATCTGVIASIVPLLLPMLHRHHPPCCAGVFALAALALPILAHPCCRPHHKLVSAQS
jgi:hypothetical protein